MGDTEIVWGVIIILCCGLAFTAYCVAYILNMAFKEMQDVEGKEQGQQSSEEAQAESGQRNSEESKERG